ncbi:MAG: hypothetical protein GY838_16305 [bacterium]|nr:hypothetical protein [bacterium]
MRRCTTAALTILLLAAFATPLAANAQPLKLYWADEFAGRVYKSDPDGANLETIITGDYLDSEEIVLGAGRLYWSDAGRGLIQRVNTDGTALENVVVTPEPGALGFDDTDDQLYWMDTSLGEIRRANPDGTSPVTVMSLTNLGTSLAVANAGRFIVWAEFDASLFTSVIYRLNITGGTPLPITTLQGTERVRGLAVNENTHKLYFGRGGTLYEMDVAGSIPLVLHAGGVDVVAVACDAATGKVYWGDAGNHDVTRCDQDGTNIEVLETFARNVDGLAVDASDMKLYWTEERYVVQANLDGTGQVNIVTRPSFFAVGFHELLDRIYYSDMHDLVTYYAKSDGTGRTVFWSGVSVPTGGALAIEVDHYADKVYWLDGGDRWLRRADPDGTGREDLLYLTGDAYDIALDTAGQRVYWCGRGTGTIYRRAIDGTGVIDTLYTGLNSPRGLALDYEYVRVIWGEDDRIAYGDINGGGPVGVAYTDPFAVIGVVWDESGDRLYWADQLNSRVRRGQYMFAGDTWLPADNIFSMGFEHWPGRLVLEYGGVSGVDDTAAFPAREHFAAPNPFNPATVISFRTTMSGPVTCAVYDTAGRLVRKLWCDVWLPAGPQSVSWNGIDEMGRAVGSGVYMYRVEAGAERFTGKLVLVR